MNNLVSPIRPTPRDIDEKYMFELISVLFTAANYAHDGWTQVGLFANFDPMTKGMLMYTNILFDGQRQDMWLTREDDREAARTCLWWIKKLMDAGHPHWTSMFFAVTSNGHARWLPCYDEDYGPWKIHMDKDNWPAMEEALKEI